MTAAAGAPCPYVGLQPFQEADRDYFFGRERDQRIIISNLLASPLTILYGSSGVGKSSVLMAGVVPQLRRERPQTPVIVFRSWVGAEFEGDLKRQCIEEVWRHDVDQPKPAETLPFDEILRACGEAAHETVLVLFDQFEEYFLYHEKSAAPESFEAQFARAVNRDDVNVGFLIALREDSLSKLDYFQERIPNLLSNRLRLEHLDEAGARDAIRKPLEVWNAKYATGQPPVTIDDTLVDQLIAQVQAGLVSVSRQASSGAAQSGVEAPFLQLVMNRLWAEEMAAHSRALRVDTLTRLKGAQEIVRTHLEDVMNGLDATEQAVCATFFDRLVTPTGGKVACSLENLTRWAGQLGPRVPAVLAKLSAADKRILRIAAASPTDPGATSYEIYHDVLAAAILDWSRRYLDRQERIAAVQKAHEAASRRAMRGWIWRMVAMTVFAFAGWGYAFWQSLEARANQKAAESVAISRIDARRGLNLALEATDQTRQYYISPTTQAEDALRRAIQASRLEWSLPTGGWVSGLAFSPDGHELAVADKDRKVHILHAVEGTPGWSEVRTLAHSGWVHAVAFLRGGTHLATSTDQTVRVWSDTAAEERPEELPQGTSVSATLAVSRDGTRLATAGGGQRAIQVWSLTDGRFERVATIDVGGAWIMGLAFSPDGSCLATANVELGSKGRSFTEVWSIGGGRKILSVPNPSPSDTVAFTPDGQTLVTGSRDDRVRVWRPAVEDLDAVLKARDAVAVARAFDVPARVDAMAETDPPDLVWSVRQLPGHLDVVRDVAVSPDGSRLASASADGTAIIWDLDTGEHLLTLSGHDQWVDAVAFTPDSQQVATGGRDGTIKMWNVASHSGGGLNSIAFSPDGTKVATAGGDHTAALWEVSENGAARWLHQLRGHGNKIYRLAFDATGRRLATAGFDNRVMLWDVASGERLQTFEGHKDELRDVAFNSDGTRLATVGADGRGLLRIVDGAHDAAEPIVVIHNAQAKEKVQASAVTFHPSQPLWVTAGWDGTLQRWDFAGNNQGRITRPRTASATPPRFTSIAYSPDGREIAALAGHIVSIWPATAFGEVPVPRSAVLIIPDARVCTSLAYSRDGAQLAVACGDGSVRIYDASRRVLSKTVTVHSGAVTQAAFSPDGALLATASLDNTFHISPLRFDALYDVATHLRDATAPSRTVVAAAGAATPYPEQLSLGAPGRR